MSSPSLSPIANIPLPDAREPADFLDGVATTVYRLDPSNGAVVEDYTKEFYFPVWQNTPASPSLVNYNLLSHTIFGIELEETLNSGNILIGKTFTTQPSSNLASLYESANQETSIDNEPLCQVYVPVFDKFNDSRTIVGIIAGLISWRDYFVNNLPASATEPIVCVLESESGQFSFLIQGAMATYLGEGDKHDSKFDYLEESFDFANMVEVSGFETSSGVQLNVDFCPYGVRIFPTQEMQDMYITNKPRCTTRSLLS
jgi:hypothetical protein